MRKTVITVKYIKVNIGESVFKVLAARTQTKCNTNQTYHEGAAHPIKNGATVKSER